MRRIFELPGLVHYGIEERHTRPDAVAVVNSLSRPQDGGRRTLRGRTQGRDVGTADRGPKWSSPTCRSTRPWISDSRTRVVSSRPSASRCASARAREAARRHNSTKKSLWADGRQCSKRDCCTSRICRSCPYARADDGVSPSLDQVAALGGDVAVVVSTDSAGVSAITMPSADGGPPAGTKPRAWGRSGLGVGAVSVAGGVAGAGEVAGHRSAHDVGAQDAHGEIVGPDVDFLCLRCGAKRGRGVP